MRIAEILEERAPIWSDANPRMWGARSLRLCKPRSLGEARRMWGANPSPNHIIKKIYREEVQERI